MDIRAVRQGTRRSSVVAAICAVALIVAPQPTPARAGDQPTPMPVAPLGLDAPRFAPDRVVVKFKSPAARAQALSAVGARSVDTPGATAAAATVLEVEPAERDAVLARLSTSPAVEYAELDPVVHAQLAPNDRMWRYQWGSRRVHAPLAWNISRGRRGTMVAVLDTGVSSHPDLRGGLMRGYDFVHNDRNAADAHPARHGTQVAGVVAARGNNRRGVAGLCWNCRVLPVRVLNWQADGFASDVARGIRYAVRRGADIVNMSFGGPRGSRTLRDAVDFARRRGVVLVAAAGNANSRTRMYPAAYPGVISVAGSNRTDRRYRDPANRSLGSNHGTWVDLAAPWENATTGANGGYYLFPGTSSAAPVVSGVAALLKSQRPNISARRIQQLLFRTAVRNRKTRFVAHGRVEADRPLVWQVHGRPVMGDWNGDGRDTPGWFKRGRWYLSNRLNAKRPFAVFRFGNPGDQPVVGDWNGDGKDSIGIRRGDRWLLRNWNTSGRVNHSFRFGGRGGQAVAGDWDADGRDTIGVRRGEYWLLRDTLNAGRPDHRFRWGHRSDRPLIGDWNRNGRDTVGVRRGRKFLLLNRLRRARAGTVFHVGARRDRAVVGDFDGDRRDTISLVRGNRWKLRNRLARGPLSTGFRYGG